MGKVSNARWAWYAEDVSAVGCCVASLDLHRSLSIQISAYTLWLLLSFYVWYTMTAWATTLQEHLAAPLRIAGGAQCTVSVDGPSEKIASEAAMHLRQITQEATRNAIRHGQADEITITLNVSEGRGKLSIRDNGTGISSGSENGAGLGLRAMRYGADLIDVFA